jgi:hypothetical protein
MGMSALVLDEQAKALDAANCWHECDEARELLAKIDAFEILSDRWCGECSQAAKGFTEAAREAEDALDDMRGEIVCRVARALSGEGRGDAYEDAWVAADDDASPVKQLVQSARRAHAGDDYLRRFAA